MDLQDSLVKNLVMKVKRDILSSNHVVDDIVYSLHVSPSAYDTAWLAMVPNPQEPDHPLFSECLDWVLRHQNPGGSWPGLSGINISTIDCLTSTLACMVALATWNVGHTAIQKGLAFIHANAEQLLKEENGCFPDWFILIFPAMVDLATTKGLHVYFSNGSKSLVQQVFHERQQLLLNKTKRFVFPDGQKNCDQIVMPPYLEALPETYFDILLQQSEDSGFIIQSPSSTAYAFMKTGDIKFLANLNSVVQMCGYGSAVPAIYPLDDNLVKICLIDRIETLGLSEYFMDEMKTLLHQIYRNYVIAKETIDAKGNHLLLPLQLYRDSLAFRLLRLHGYTISPSKFCWFLQDEDMVAHIEEHHETFMSAMYNVYRATDLTFSRESQLEDARAFSKTILEKETKNVSQSLQDQIKHEISRPWLARLDHLEHRKCIERKQTIDPWTGTAFSYRLSFSKDALLRQLAVANYSLRQSIFRDELKELEMWTKDMGLSDMGFARQKTAYCYFAVASTASAPSLSDVRLAVAKSAILVTVADDFFDAEGSLSELEALTIAINRWQQKCLNGHSKTIFRALKDLLDDISMQFFNKDGYDISIYLQELWHQTFEKWLKEAEWSRSGHSPSTAEYLQVATSSIATHTILLPAALLLCPSIGVDILKCPQSEKVTKLLMVLTRLLNELESYKKEQIEGKQNLVLLHMKENDQSMGVEESITDIQKILEDKKKEFLEEVLVNGRSDLPEACKLLHFRYLKVFQMFYNSKNVFDSPTELLADINQAIYDPLKVSVASSYSRAGTKNLQVQNRVAGANSKPLNRVIESRVRTTGVMIVRGTELSTKPYARILSLSMTKQPTFTTIPKPNACAISLWPK